MACAVFAAVAGFSPGDKTGGLDLKSSRVEHSAKTWAIPGQ